MEYADAMTLKIDASAAVGIANRIGVGKVRHVEVSQLWLQQKVADGEVVIQKVPGGENVADALTKAADASALRAHIVATHGGEISDDRHPLAPREEGQEG